MNRRRDMTAHHSTSIPLYSPATLPETFSAFYSSFFQPISLFPHIPDCICTCSVLSYLFLNCFHIYLFKILLSALLCLHAPSLNRTVSVTTIKIQQSLYIYKYILKYNVSAFTLHSSTAYIGDIYEYEPSG